MPTLFLDIESQIKELQKLRKGGGGGADENENAENGGGGGRGVSS